MDRNTLLFGSEEDVRSAAGPSLDAAEAALTRLEQGGPSSLAREYLRPSIAWMDEAVREIFGGLAVDRVRMEAHHAVLRAPHAAWRLRYPGYSLVLTFTDALREMARDYGIPAAPLHPPNGAECLHAAASTPAPAMSARRSLLEEFVRLGSANHALDRIGEVFGLNTTELGRLFGVSRQAVDQWRERGIPAERSADIDRVRELTELYHREFIPERIPQIVRQPVERLGGRTVLDAIADDGPAVVREYLARTFAFLAA